MAPEGVQRPAKAPQREDEPDDIDEDDDEPLSMIDQARGQLALAIEDAESAESIDVRTKARSQVVAIMRTINDMEKRAEDLEGRAVRSSNFLQRVINTVLESVKGHPEVSERLERALEDLDLRKEAA
jgi:Mg2+ and Co2+ transporter CorA